MTEGPGQHLSSVEDVLAVVLSEATPATTGEWVHLADAVGRVAAADVSATFALPPWDNSAMDGYAVRYRDVGSATDAVPVRLAVVGDVPAGEPPGSGVGPGTAMRIATGARIPAGADAVVPVEETTPADPEGAATGSRGRDASGPLPPTILVHSAVPGGGAIRRRASDLAAGTVVWPSGREVNPAGVAILAGAGLDGLLVRRRPVVGVMATGDELRSPGADLGESGIPDSNGPALHAYVESAGGDPRNLGIAADRLEDVRSRLRTGLAGAPDMIIVSGGVSVGPYDHVKSAFAEVGRIAIWRVAVQPGKPFVFGTAVRPGDGHPVLLFGLPGNPVSTFVTFELFVRPALRRLAGYRDPGRRLDRAVLADTTPKSAGRRAFLRVRADRDDRGMPIRDRAGRVIVRLVGGIGGQGSHVLSALADADALAIIPEGVTIHPAGGPVELWWLDGS